MQTITTIGLDIAKSVFQVHGVDAVHSFMQGLATLLTPPVPRRDPSAGLS
jgi:hypothetical protein